MLLCFGSLTLSVSLPYNSFNTEQDMYLMKQCRYSMLNARQVPFSEFTEEDKLLSPFQELFRQLQVLEKLELEYRHKLQGVDSLIVAQKGTLWLGFLRMSRHA